VRSLEEVLDDRRKERIIEGLNQLDQDQFRSLMVDLLENLGLEVTAAVITDGAVRIEASGEDGIYLVTASQRREIISVESLRRLREKADFVERLPVLIATREMDAESAFFADSNDIAYADLSKLLLLVAKFGLEDRILSDVDRHILEMEGGRFLPSIGRYDHLVKEAEKDLKEERGGEALEKLDRALELKSNQDHVWRMRARALHAMGDDEGAVSACGRAVELDSRNPANRYLLALMLHESGDPEGEVESYESALKLNPRFLPAMINKGATLFEMGLLEESLRTFDRMTKLFPKDPRGFNNRALIRREMGDSEKALVDVERALSIDPDNREALINRADILSGSDDLHGAIDAWRDILAMNRSQPNIWMEMGDVQMRVGLFEEAARSYAVAASLDPDLQDARERRDAALESAGIIEGEELGGVVIYRRYIDASLLLRAIGDLEGSLSEIDKCLELEPSSPHALLDRGHILLEMDNFEEALASIGDSARSAGFPQPTLDLEALLHRMGRLKECSRILEGAEGSPEAGRRKCLLHLEGGDPSGSMDCSGGLGEGDLESSIEALSALGCGNVKRALSLLEGLVESHPMSPWLINSKGVALWSSGELDGAERAFRDSVEMESKYADGWNNLGAVLYFKGEYQDAERCFEQALLIRSMPIYLTSMGTCRLSLDDLEGARESFLSALRMEQSPEAINGMGIVSERSKELVRALEFYREALNRAPEFSDARMNLKRVSKLLED